MVEIRKEKRGRRKERRVVWRGRCKRARVESGVAAWKQGAYASENESECRGAYVNGSDMECGSVGEV